MIKSNIGKFLKLAGLTQKELAERIGTTEVSISRYASGDRIPKATTCIQIAKVLNCNAEDLFEEISDNESVMTENEAVNVLQSNRPFAYSELQNAVDMAIQALEENQKYRAIGTVYECRVAVEKMKPWEVQYHEFGRDEGYPYCKCGKRLIDNLVGVNYCPECGQKLDWSE